VTEGQVLVLGLLLAVAVAVLLQRRWTRPRTPPGAALPESARATLPSGFTGSGALFFHSPTCGPCKAMMPGVRSLDDERDDVWILDVREHGAAVQALGIRATPTLVVLRDGVVTAARVGFLSPDGVRALVDA